MHVQALRRPNTDPSAAPIAVRVEGNEGYEMTRIAPGIGRVGLVAIFLGLFLMQLDMAIVNVAIADIRSDLGGGGYVAWIIDAYTLPIAALLLTAGTLGDQLGHRRLYLGGLGVFLVGSVACALAPSLAALIAARVLQGIGASTLAPASLALLVRAVPDATAQRRAVGLWGSIGGLGLVAGPLVGGVLTGLFGWSSVFLFTAAATVVAILAATRLDESREADDRPIDGPGLVVASITLAALIASLIEGPQAGWLAPFTVACVIVAGAGIVAFVMVERHADEPMIPPRLLRNPSFAAVNGATILMTFGNFGFLLVYSLFLQQDHDLSSPRAGLHLLPISLGVTVGAAVAHRLIEWIGLTATAASAFVGEAALLVAFLILGDSAAIGPLTVLLFGLGLATGFQLPPMVSLGVQALPARDAGLASGITNTSRQVGAALGSGLLGSIFAGGWRSVTVTVAIAGAGFVVAGILAAAARPASSTSASEPTASPTSG